MTLADEQNLWLYAAPKVVSLSYGATDFVQEAMLGRSRTNVFFFFWGGESVEQAAQDGNAAADNQKRRRCLNEVTQATDRMANTGQKHTDGILTQQTCSQ